MLLALQSGAAKHRAVLWGCTRPSLQQSVSSASWGMTDVQRHCDPPVWCRGFAQGISPSCTELLTHACRCCVCKGVCMDPNLELPVTPIRGADAAASGTAWMLLPLRESPLCSDPALSGSCTEGALCSCWGLLWQLGRGRANRYCKIAARMGGVSGLGVKGEGRWRMFGAAQGVGCIEPAGVGDAC